MVNKDYKNPWVLHCLYHERGMKLREVGDIFGVATSTIYRWMKRNDIPVQTTSETLKGREITWGDKISETLEGRSHSQERRRKIGEACKGKTLSKEHIQGISEANSGPKSEEHRRKLSEAHRGKTHSDETKRILSEKLSGEGNPNYGKPRSKETRRKISEANSEPESNNGQGYGCLSYWKKQRRKVLKRDDYQCQECGMSNKEHKDISPQDNGLLCHHIIPRSEFEFTNQGERDWDEIKEGHSVGNLVMLCNSCHAKAENRPKDFEEYHGLRSHNF